MATETLLLDGVGANDAWVLAAGASKVAACNGPDDDDTSTIRSTATAGTVQRFTLASPAAIGSGDTINSVSLRVRCKYVSQQGRLVGTLWLGGNSTETAQISTGASWADHNESAMARPGGGAWAFADLAGLEVSVVNVQARDVAVTTLEVVVDYTPGEDEGVEGALTATVGAVALQASGAPEVVGAAAGALGPVALAAAGALLVSGKLDAGVVGVVALAAEGAPEVVGAAAAGIGGVVLVGEGAPVAAGEAAATVGAVELAAEGGLLVSGELAAAIGGVTLAAAGSASNTISGMLATPIGDVTLAALGAPVVGGELAGIVGDVVLAGEGTTTVAGAMAVVIDDVMLQADGTLLVSGAAVADVGAVTVAAVGVAGMVVVQVYSAELLAQPSPSLGLVCNAEPGVALASQPSPAVEVMSG